MEFNIKNFLEHKEKIAVIGLGYVGLPLAVSLGSKYSIIGFDISKKRILELKQCKDSTKEIDSEKIKQANITFTYDPSSISKCKLIIIAVPTPIDPSIKPNLKFIKQASEIVGKYMKKNSFIVYESTVYPGLTEEF